MDFNTLRVQPTAARTWGREAKEILCTEPTQAGVEREWISTADNDVDSNAIVSKSSTTASDKNEQWWEDRSPSMRTVTLKGEFDTSASCDVIKSSFLKEIDGLRIGNFIPYWTNDVIHLFSVTADSLDEEAQLQKFLLTLEPDLLAVVRKHESVFAPPDSKPPERSVKHRIRLHQDAFPIKRRPYPLPPHKIETMRTQITELAQKV